MTIMNLDKINRDSAADAERFLNKHSPHPDALTSTVMVLLSTARAKDKPPEWFEGFLETWEHDGHSDTLTVFSDLAIVDIAPKTKRVLQ